MMISDRKTRTFCQILVFCLCFVACQSEKSPKALIEIHSSVNYGQVSFPEGTNFPRGLTFATNGEPFYVKTPGNAGTAGSVSFESVNSPGHFVRHQDYILKIDVDSKDSLFQQDSTFFLDELSDNSGYVSIRSLNFPDHHWDGLSADSLKIVKSSPIPDNEKFKILYETANLALGKPARSSSKYANSYPATWLVDGNDSPYFADNTCACTNYEAYPWMVVDLQREFKIDKIVIVNRQEAPARLANLNIGLASWTDDVTKPNHSPVNYEVCEYIKDPLGAGEKREIDCSHVDGTYSHVILQIMGTQYLTVCELEVYTAVIDLDCSQDGVKIDIDTDRLVDFDLHNLHVGQDASDTSCTFVQGEGSHLTADIGLESCGVIRTSDVTNMNYLYEISASGYTADAVGITREQLVGMTVTCSFKRTGQVTAQYTAQTTVAKYSATEFGSLVLSMSLYTDSSLQTVVTAPVVLNTELYALVKLTAALKLNLFVRSCSATPSREGSTQDHDLIKDGCFEDETTKENPDFSSHTTEYSYEFKAFKFKASGLNDVYLSCEVVVCTTDSTEDICQDPASCPNARSLDLFRRDAPIQGKSESFTIQHGPFKVY